MEICTACFRKVFSFNAFLHFHLSRQQSYIFLLSTLIILYPHVVLFLLLLFSLLSSRWFLPSATLLSKVQCSALHHLTRNQFQMTVVIKVKRCACSCCRGEYMLTHVLKENLIFPLKLAQWAIMEGRAEGRLEDILELLHQAVATFLWKAASELLICLRTVYNDFFLTVFLLWLALFFPAWIT